MVAMSPRDPPPRLKSTSAEKGESPRKKQSLFQEVALSRGYTVRAGAGRRRRLQSHRGKVVFDSSGLEENYGQEEVGSDGEE